MTINELLQIYTLLDRLKGSILTESNTKAKFEWFEPCVVNGRGKVLILNKNENMFIKLFLDKRDDDVFIRDWDFIYNSK